MTALAIQVALGERIRSILNNESTVLGLKRKIVSDLMRKIENAVKDPKTTDEQIGNNNNSSSQIITDLYKLEDLLEKYYREAALAGIFSKIFKGSRRETKKEIKKLYVKLFPGGIIDEVRISRPASIDNGDSRRHPISGSSADHIDVFNQLPFRLKPCFLYLGIFPDDADIEVNTICHMWIAEGLISMKDRKSNESTPMDVAERYIQELDEKNLVAIEQVVSGKRKFQSCRINRPTRDLCKNQGREDELFEVIQLGVDHEKQENTTRSSAIRRALYLDKYERTKSELYGNADYLRSLLFFSSCKSETEIRQRKITNLDQFIALRVLYPHGVDFDDGKLPKGVEKLVYLRYLSLRECYLLEMPPALCKMLYLQTLDLRIRSECKMTIPSHVLNKFPNLKYLYFPEYNQIVGNFKLLSLKGLKELEILENFDTSWCNVEELPKLLILKKLGITTEAGVSEIQSIMKIIDSNWNLSCSISLTIRNLDCRSQGTFSVMENVFNSPSFHTLGVKGHIGKFPEFNTGKPWELTEIILNDSQLTEDPMQVLQMLPNLKILVLEFEAYIRGEMKCTSSSFPQLVYLKLFKLYNLKTWEVEKGAMKNLRTLVINNCPEFHMIPDGFQFITNLRKLEIASMPDKLKLRIQKLDGTEGEDLYKIAHVLPNVKVDGQLLIIREKQQGKHDVGNTPGNGDEMNEEGHIKGTETPLEGNHDVGNGEDHMTEERHVTSPETAILEASSSLSNKKPQVPAIDFSVEEVKLDEATATLSKPSVARICIEVDLKKNLPDSVWVSQGDHLGFYQHVLNEDLPLYSNACFRFGHSRSECKNLPIEPVVPKDVSSSDTQRQRGIAKRIPDSVPKAPSVEFATGQNSRELEIHFPNFIRSHIGSFYNVKTDGHCGFRSVALLVKDDEEKWLEVRRDLYDELLARQELYTNVMNTIRFNEAKNALEHWNNGGCPKEKWMTLPDHGWIIATKYDKIVVTISASARGSVTFLPLIRTNEQSNPNIIVIGHICENHFISLKLEDDELFPPIHPSWEEHREPSLKLLGESLAGKIAFWETIESEGQTQPGTD